MSSPETRLRAYQVIQRRPDLPPGPSLARRWVEEGVGQFPVWEAVVDAIEEAEERGRVAGALAARGDSILPTAGFIGGRVRVPGDGPKCRCGKPAVWSGYCYMEDGKGSCRG